MDGLWEDLKQPVKDAGQGGQLNTFPEFSVAFWRWAIWKLFEANNAPQKGVIAFISNRKFLTGWPYAGLRKMMRERFDRIEVIDLRGDVRTGKRGDVYSDQGVFNIMVGTAITLAIADGTKAEGALAEVVYTDCWKEGLFGRKSKLDWLVGEAKSGEMPNSTSISRDSMEDWRPRPFDNGDWLSLRDAFVFAGSGIQTKRNHFVYDVQADALRRRIETFLRADPINADKEFKPTPAKPVRKAQAHAFNEKSIVATAFRPLDVRYLYNQDAYIDRKRPELQSCWGEQNVGIYTHHFGVGAGPAIWSHVALPDYDLWCGRGGYAFPLYDRRAGPDAHNLNPVLVAALAEAYGSAQTPEDIFDAILCLLSAQSYTRRFAEDLEDTFPHIPFPADPAVFARAVAIGREIRGIEAFQRDPARAFRPKPFCKLVADTDGGAVIGDVAYRDGELSLWKADGKAVPTFTGLPEAVWGFSVSGYRVLPRWIDGRKGLPFTDALKNELRDVAARIHELIHWFGQADLVLEATLVKTVSRTGLGFPPPEPEEVDDGDD